MIPGAIATTAAGFLVCLLCIMAYRWMVDARNWSRLVDAAGSEEWARMAIVDARHKRMQREELNREVNQHIARHYAPNALEFSDRLARGRRTKFEGNT